MVLEGFAPGLHVARPQERGVALHACVSIAVQRIDALVRPVHLMTFEIHPIACKAGWGVEPIALIGPPTIYAEIEQRLVYRPIATHLTITGPTIIRTASAGQRR